MLTFIDVWRWGILWGILINSITASESSVLFAARCDEELLDVLLRSYDDDEA